MGESNAYHTALHHHTVALSDHASDRDHDRTVSSEHPSILNGFLDRRVWECVNQPEVKVRRSTMKTRKNIRNIVTASLMTLALGSTPAMAGPVAAAAMLAAGTSACSASWVLGPWALLCYAGTGLASAGSLFIPSP